MQLFRQFIPNIILAALIYPAANSYSEEQVISRENLSNDIKIIFEAAPKDTLFNDSVEQLSEQDTDIHIEALVNWNDDISIDGQKKPGLWENGKKI